MKYVLILVNILCLVLGQTSWKLGMENMQLHGNIVQKFFQFVFSPLIFLGFVLYILATVIWMYLLSKLPLSFLYPLQSLAYVFSLIIAFLIFKEHIPITRWIGTGVILFGVYLIVK
ncbi:EamA family transporter [Ectobacillus sp. JY-23]|uniref:EamA family transporter n=1 Tax=Ectobacillus sp. JY-23 TaxID=2933872 RepID=UPI001FF26620|nr:EamA family transporter [Ectobacillus sp. JY-23]UOY91321.1 EamA family transporter [Ectobacillus sp. JY-23]